MSRSTVRCAMGHTSLFIEKNDVRTSFFEKFNKASPLVTISHGALDVLNIMRWRGPIQVTDIDPGVCERMQYIIEDRRYPRLNLLPVIHCRNIQDTVLDYCEESSSHRPLLVDADLTETLPEVWPIFQDVSRILGNYKRKAHLLLTFRNGRDYFGKKAIERRLEWAHRYVPGNAKLVSHRCYRSDWIGRYATSEIGSSMCAIEFQVN